MVWLISCLPVMNGEPVAWQVVWGPCKQVEHVHQVTFHMCTFNRHPTCPQCLATLDCQLFKWRINIQVNHTWINMVHFLKSYSLVFMTVWSVFMAADGHSSLHMWTSTQPHRRGHSFPFGVIWVGNPTIYSPGQINLYVLHRSPPPPNKYCSTSCCIQNINTEGREALPLKLLHSWKASWGYAWVRHWMAKMRWTKAWLVSDHNMLWTCSPQSSQYPPVFTNLSLSPYAHIKRRFLGWGHVPLELS